MTLDSPRLSSHWALWAVVVAVTLGGTRVSRATDDPNKQDSGPAPSPAAAQGRTEAEEYYDLLKLFVDTLDQVDRNYVKDTSRRELMEAAIEGMLSKLDRYSDYIPPSDLERFRSGVENEFGGIGIQIGVRDGALTIISPLVGTPAYRAGLMAGDQIVRIGGKSTKEMSIDDARDLLTGKLGTEVTFTVLHPHNGETETVSLTREIIRVQTVLGYERQADGGWNYLADADRKIAYLRVSAFGRHTVDELRDTLKKLSSEGMRALVLDLSFNPGGLLAAAIETSDLFITSGLIVSTEGRNTPKQTWEAHDSDSFAAFPMAVLVNRSSASASEIVAACLQDHQRAVIVGERTWGKGSVQNIIELEGGKSALKLTTAGYHRPSGKNIDRGASDSEDDDWGVQPDEGYKVELSPADRTRLYLSLRDREILPPRSRKTKPDAAEESVANEAEVAELFLDVQLQKSLEYLARQLSSPPQDDAKQTGGPPAESSPQPQGAGTPPDAAKVLRPAAPAQASRR